MLALILLGIVVGSLLLNSVSRSAAATTSYTSPGPVYLSEIPNPSFQATTVVLQDGYARPDGGQPLVRLPSGYQVDIIGTDPSRQWYEVVLPVANSRSYLEAWVPTSALDSPNPPDWLPVVAAG